MVCGWGTLSKSFISLYNAMASSRRFPRSPSPLPSRRYTERYHYYNRCSVARIMPISPDSAAKKRLRNGVHYRSPWSLRLRDGRIVVLFGRRKAPFGIGLIVSEDDGNSWSAEGIIRAGISATPSPQNLTTVVSLPLTTTWRMMETTSGEHATSPAVSSVCDKT